MFQEECAAGERTDDNGDPGLGSGHPQHLNELLDVLLHPDKPIDDAETVEWLRSLIGGGRDYDEFARQVKHYDSTAVCGLVWTADFMAYRCRTCQVRPLLVKIKNSTTGITTFLFYRSPLVCHCVPSVSRTATTKDMTSTCSNLRPVEHVIVETSVS